MRDNLNDINVYKFLLLFLLTGSTYVIPGLGLRSRNRGLGQVQAARKKGHVANFLGESGNEWTVEQPTIFSSDRAIEPHNFIVRTFIILHKPFFCFNVFVTFPFLSAFILIERLVLKNDCFL